MTFAALIRAVSLPTSNGPAPMTSLPLVRIVWLAIALGCASPNLHANSSDGLPRGERLSNTNTLGPVTVTVSLVPARPKIGDEVVLTLEVGAEDDVEVLMPEFGESLQGYSVTQFVPQREIRADGSSLERQTYTLQPDRSGPQAIPPILVEFVDHRPGQSATPDDFDAYEISTDRIDFEVQSVVPRGAALELRPPSDKLALAPDRTSRTWLLAGLAILGVLAAIIGVLAWRQRRHQVRRANAYEIARSRLDRLLSGQQAQESALSIELFFVEISAIIRQYLEHRFDLSAPDLTTDEFLQVAARESDLSNEHQSLLSEFLKQADVVKFAGVRATAEDMRHSTDLAMRFLEDTRAAAPDIEVEGDDAGGKPGSAVSPTSREAAGHA